jgi:hypothetical protein
MTMKPIFKVVDIPATATAQEMETLLNGPTNDGYTLHSLSPSGHGVGARAVFKLPARRVNGAWVRE